MELKVQRLCQEASLPTKNHQSDTGFDLYAAETVCLQSGERKAIRTGIVCEFPEGFGGEIRGRSGLSLKTGLTVIHGTIDTDYRGELKVIVHNFGSEYTIQKGDRFAQLVLERVYPCTLVEGEITQNTSRGVQGFGSSGQ